MIIYLFNRTIVLMLKKSFRDMLDCDIVVSEFELQSCYYVHIWTNAPWEKYELYLPGMG